MKHIVSIDDIDIDYDLEAIRYFQGSDELIIQRTIANLFYEPSTRTSSSFYAAARKIGYDVLSINNVQYSSVVKGETLEDTIRTLECYVDCIVLRHNITGAAARAAAVSSVPIINAGDGEGEHPTQTLLDLYTIYERFGRIDDLNIVVMGDLKYGRTVHSLVRALASRCHIDYVAPSELSGEYDSREILESKIAEKCDVLYVTRAQRERHPANHGKMEYGFTRQNASELNPNAIVLHPFPRTEELGDWFDSDPRARYFDQIRNGVLVRSWLLYKVLSE